MTQSTTHEPTPARRPTDGGVLLFGRHGPRAVASIVGAAREARLETKVESNLRDFDARLHHSRPVAVVVDGAARDTADACRRVRQDPRLAGVPILGTADTVRDLGFEQLFGWGGDDLTVHGEPEAITRRLRALAPAADLAPGSRRGLAVVADLDRRSRLLVGRTLRNAGLGVTFALDVEELIRKASSPDVVAVVQAASLDAAAGESAAYRARRVGVTPPWVVTTPPRDAGALRARTAALANVAVHDSYGSPENVLFLLNELGRGALPDGRASARVLYGTTVRFRAAGSEVDEVGFSYNISARGIFVRTLAPPPPKTELWIELRPPRCDRLVRLEGQVVWLRRFGPNDRATVPAGFAIETIHGSARDVECYASSYAAYASQTLGRRVLG
jgi:hypothetical protein